MSNRTNRHYLVLEAIRKYMDEHQQAPTLNELADLAGISMALTYYYLAKPEQEELISREKQLPRSIQLIGAAQVMRIPRSEPRKREKPDRNGRERLSRKKMSKADEIKCFEEAVKLGKKNDALASGVAATHDRLHIFHNSRVVGYKVS
jgi:hypothetical protein